MTLEKIYFSNIIKPIISSIINLNKTKIFLLILILVPSLFVSISIQYSNYANATTPSLGQTIQQFQNNLQSNINKDIQSNINNNNNNNGNCDNGNNISIQSQTNNKGKTTSTSKTSCDGSTSFRSSNNVNLNGIIASPEYNIHTGFIVNILFGHWSLTTKGNGFNDFKASFTKQPIFYNSANNILFNSPNSNTLATTNSPNNRVSSSSSSSSINSNIQTGSLTQQQQSSDITLYNLSNFRVNSVNQQNFDKTYQGKIDVIKEIKSFNTNRPDVTNIFKDVGISISILSDRTLIINFDKQTILFNEFKDIPLVGMVQ
ncbi:MAG: hypothetical protein ABJB76_04920 [Candidatus Nitrosocosmicus sp.]